MHIDSYSFGSIIVDGKTYKNDVIIFPERVRSEWWRAEGHLLQMKDLREVVKYGPEVLVIGKGATGVMTVPRELIEELEKKGMEVVVKNTDEACHVLNDMIKKNKKAVGAFHLTC